MKREDKELLVKDLCARLPYGVKIYGNYSYSDGDKIIDDIQTKTLDIYDIDWVIHNIEIKPYLFPLSSMTEEQKIIYGDLCYQIINATPFEIQNCFNELYNWLIKNNFDYQGLIPMGLAIDATGLGVY